MKVTLYEVAARAGVSIATVSRALNGLPVSARSDKRVREAASALGYVANEAARSLRSDRTLTMGLIFHDLNNTLGIKLVDAIGASIEAAGYALLIASARGDAGRYDLLMHRFLERRVDALFCIDPHGAGDALPLYKVARTPVLALFRAGAAFTELPLLAPSFAEAAAAVVAEMRALGHARVALIADRPRTPPLAALGQALQADGVTCDWITPSEVEGMGDVLAGLLARSPRPTTVIARAPHARGLLAAAAAARIRTPAELSVVAISEIGDEARGKRAALSALVVDPSRMGRAAAGTMLAWLAGSAPAERISVEAARWRPAATTGRAPAAVRLAG